MKKINENIDSEKYLKDYFSSIDGNMNIDKNAEIQAHELFLKSLNYREKKHKLSDMFFFNRFSFKLKLAYSAAFFIIIAGSVLLYNNSIHSNKSLQAMKVDKKTNSKPVKQDEPKNDIAMVENNQDIQSEKYDAIYINNETRGSSQSIENDLKLQWNLKSLGKIQDSLKTHLINSAVENNKKLVTEWFTIDKNNQIYRFIFCFNKSNDTLKVRKETRQNPDLKCKNIKNWKTIYKNLREQIEDDIMP